MAFKEIEQDMNQKIKKIRKSVEKSLRRTLEQTEKTLGAVASDVQDQINVPFLRKSLDSALDLLRPHAVSLGLRIAKLSSRHVEIVIPTKLRNCDENGFILTGVLISAGLEACSLLWGRAAPEMDYGWKVTGLNWRGMQKVRHEVRLRTEINEILRETLFADLNRKKETHWESKILFFNGDDQIIGELEVTIEIQIREMLDWK